METDSSRITYYQLPDGTKIIGIHPVDHKYPPETPTSDIGNEEWSSQWGKPTKEQLADEAENNATIARLSPKHLETSLFAKKAMLYTSIGGVALILAAKIIW